MKKLLKSMSIAIIAQIVSLLLSLFVSFYVSKYMSIREYGYYQLFLFYSTYVGILQFGASEGIYLLNGGKEYSDIDKHKVHLLFRNILFFMVCILILLVLAVQGKCHDIDKKNVLVLILIYAIIYFCVTYFGYLLQATKKITKYSFAIVVGKLFTLVCFIILVKNRIFQYQIYCLLYLGGYIVSTVIIIYNCRDIVFAKVKNEWIIKESKEIIVSGMSLLFSNLVSSFIVGINRVYIEKGLGIEIFGKVSMSLSLSNFMSLFAIQIGLVIFPNVVNLSQDVKIKTYETIEKLLKYMAFIIFLVYIPLKYILNLWIPQYTESISWMFLLIPYTVYEIKNQVLYITYLKALREEKYLFKTNILAMFSCATINFVMIFQMKNLEGVFLVLNVVVICKSLLLNKKIHKELEMGKSYGAWIEVLSIMIISLMYYHEIKYCVVYMFGFYSMLAIYDVSAVVKKRKRMIIK